MLTMVMVLGWMVMVTEQVLWAQLQRQAKEAWKPEEATGKGFKVKTFGTQLI